jgi:threonine/homoserine/homoserine lactone efflux protein
VSLILTPGPAKLLLLSISASRGFSAGLKLAVGIFLSDAIHVTLVAIGLGSLIVANGNLRAAIAVLGAGCLAYFAWLYGQKAIHGPIAKPGPERVDSGAGLLGIGLLLNLFNPLAIAFYIGLLPQFADPALPMSVTTQLGIYGGALVALFLAVHTLIALAASAFKRTAVSPLWFRISYGLAAAVLLWLCGRMLIGTFG